ncbi:hypothetical protein T4B_12891 [Trichinella pseudospiralis]|uniref:Uncharacterized protein n=1 Tax=Trichinella pseudospiralis TaxID=6337 RepID=A0A0V1IR47_TRIPS|nr:hypothetical protein T4B_12891 [Trichinella pseudospiralis]KRZ34407.1 hypothetical protein T4C_6506 [Trichinella pseudospiralis]
MKHRGEGSRKKPSTMARQIFERFFSKLHKPHRTKQRQIEQNGRPNRTTNLNAQARRRRRHSCQQTALQTHWKSFRHSSLIRIEPERRCDCSSREPPMSAKVRLSYSSIVEIAIQWVCTIAVDDLQRWPSKPNNQLQS